MSNVSDFIIEDGVLTQYVGPGGDVVIPEGVSAIGRSAFYMKSNVKSVTIPAGVTEIRDQAFAYCWELEKITVPDSVIYLHETAFQNCRKLQDENGFVIVKDKLFAYHGSAKTVVIPAEITCVCDSAFASHVGVEEVIFPEHTVEILHSAFYGCSNLKRIVMTVETLEKSAKKSMIFGDTGKTVELVLLREGTEPMQVVGAFRKAYWAQSWAYEEDYLVPLTDKDLPNYDRLVAAGDFEGFKMNEQGRLKAMILRLQDKKRPVASEYRNMYTDFLSGKINKVIRMAEEDNNVSYVLTAIEAGAVTDANKKKFTNALKKSDISEIKQLAERVDDIVVSITQDSPEDIATVNIEKKYLDRFKKINAKAVLLKSGLEKVPDVQLANGNELAPAEYVQLILAEYMAQLKKKHYELAPLADEVASLLDKTALVSALVTLYETTQPEGTRITFLPVVFRYADGVTVGKLYRHYKKEKWTEATADKCLLLSDTREAMLLAEQHKLLDQYAQLRGTTAGYLRDTVLYDFGFDEDGIKYYDLGNKTIEVSLNSDLTLRLWDVSNGNVVKSLPKKDADPDLYAAASADFSETKKNIKKAAKNKNDRLFQELLNGQELSAEKWKAAYLVNPLLRQIAMLLVWEQKGKTFILAGKTIIDVTGREYPLSNDPIRLAHPIEMQPVEITAWQKYFTSHNLKQPFEQMWEPVVAPDAVARDRYKGCMIPYYRFSKQEKHGIVVCDYDYHNEIEISFVHCNATVDRIDIRRHEINMNDRFEVVNFSFEKYTRRVNHIVAYLDRITIYERVRNDDQTIAQFLPRFTLAQISDFIKVAAKNNCTNVAAILLDYKNKNFSDFDPMDEFTLSL